MLKIFIINQNINHSSKHIHKYKVNVPKKKNLSKQNKNFNLRDFFPFKAKMIFTNLKQV